MKQFFVQYLKDFKANFSNFNAYIIIGGYCILSFAAAFYLGDYFIRESNIFSSFFIMQPMILMLIIPAITMRSWADEIKSGTIELLLTQPISYHRLVLAKFAAALSFFSLMLLCSIPFLIITDKFAILDFGIVILGYISVFLTGALFVAVGCLISIFNRNNILSYISTIFVIFFITQFEASSLHFGSFVLPLRILNFEDNFSAFLSGVITYSNIFYFIFYIALILWLNTVTVRTKKSGNLMEKKRYFIFIFLLFMIFASSLVASNLLLNTSFDLTSSQKYTLTSQTQKTLSHLDKRIDITLYEAKNKREDANSGYAVYAEFVERLLKLIERTSQGGVRADIVRVEPFSQQERTLLHNDVPFEKDNSENKIFMLAEFSDNEGNHQMINSFSNLRQNLLETDVMRVIHRFGLPKKNVALIMSSNDKEQSMAFGSILREFYNVTELNSSINFIPPTYSAVIVVNPLALSSEFLLAMEQYVLNGGSLIIFSEPLNSTTHNGKILDDFLKNYGIRPIPGAPLVQQIKNQSIEIGAAFPNNNDPTWKGVRSVLVNGAGEISYHSRADFVVSPILDFNGHPIAAVSHGIFVSDHLALARETSAILPVSSTEGKVFFFYDSDMIKNYLYVSEESKGNGFYEIVPHSDNLIFILKLLDSATNEQIEPLLSYRHYILNTSSIGNAIYNNIKLSYADQNKVFQDKLDSYLQKQLALQHLFVQQGFASVKNMEDMNQIAQNIEETQDELNKIKSIISSEAQVIIIIYTIIAIFVIPLILLLILAIFIYAVRTMKLKKIRRLIKNA